MAIREAHMKDEGERVRAYSCSHGKRFKGRKTSPEKSWSISVGRAVNLLAEIQSPIQCVNHLRQHLLQESAHSLHPVEQFDLPHPVRPSPKQKSDSPPPKVSPLQLNNQEPEFICQTMSDSFENCLDIANQMESIIAFYYTDEKNPNLVKVTEIFSLAERESAK